MFLKQHSYELPANTLTVNIVNWDYEIGDWYEILDT